MGHIAVKRTLRSGSLVVAAVATIAAAAGCSSSSGSTSSTSADSASSIPGISQQLVAAAEKEGHLTIYSGTWQPSEQAVISGFEKQYPGIAVQNYTATVSQLQTKYVSEAQSGHTIADIVQNSSPGELTTEAGQGLLKKYVIPGDSSYASDMKDSGYWYAIRLALVGIAWNTDNVTPSQSASITSVQSLTSPAWKGKLGVIDPNGGGVDYLPWYLWDTDSQLGTSFLTKLAANKPRVYSSTTAASDALASGDISVLVNGSETGLEPLADKGAPIQWKFTSPGWGLPTGQAITAKAPHPAAAELFQDYSLSGVGAALFQAQGGAPARTGLSDHRAIAKQSWYHLPTSLAPYNEQVAVKDQSQILSMFQSLFG